MLVRVPDLVPDNVGDPVVERESDADGIDVCVVLAVSETEIVLLTDAVEVAVPLLVAVWLLEKERLCVGVVVVLRVRDFVPSVTVALPDWLTLCESVGVGDLVEVFESDASRVGVRDGVPAE